MGISGGEEGARNGPSLMPGGPKEAFDALEPIITKCAAQVRFFARLQALNVACIRSFFQVADLDLDRISGKTSRRPRPLWFWYPCMVTNVSVDYNGGLLPDIILLTRCDFIGEPF